MKTAMIWGANGGIGRAVTTLLQNEDWQVIVLSRELMSLSAIEIEVDVSDAVRVESAVMEAAMEAETVDLWIYAVGDIEVKPVRDINPAGLARQLNANLSGAFLATHYSLPLLTEDAHLFYLGAISERLKLPGFAAYVAAKAGLEAFAASLAKEERQRKVTVVRPGAVETPFWDKVPMRLPKNAATPDKVARQILEAYTQGHTGQLDLI